MVIATLKLLLIIDTILNESSGLYLSKTLLDMVSAIYFAFCRQKTIN